MLEEKPELKTNVIVEGTQGDLNALCELLKVNTIPTKDLDLAS